MCFLVFNVFPSGLTSVEVDADTSYIFGLGELRIVQSERGALLSVKSKRYMFTFLFINLESPVL